MSVRATTPTSNERAGIQSVEVGFPLVDALRTSSEPMALASLARATGMTRSKAHRYLASFMRVGLVEQLSSGLYDLGPKALLLGLAAMQRVDVMQCAEPILVNLRDTVDETVVLAIWANQGPTIVRWIENRSRPVNVNVRTGSVMPILTSATGRTFLGWREGVDIEKLIAHELPGSGKLRPDANDSDWKMLAAKEGIRTMTDVVELKRRIRARGLGIADGSMFSGISAIAAPVFDHTGTLVAALAVIGPQGSIDVGEHSTVAQALTAASRLLSIRLGAALPQFQQSEARS